jgi:acyl-CoA reductase-like NAD-dependent aldehyde dehydrogenase
VLCWKLGPALAAGNIVVLKPSELTPLSTFRLCPLLVEAPGFPDGVVNIVDGYGTTAGQVISESMIIDKVAFTGSSLIRRGIMEAAAKSDLEKISLELGGKNLSIIFDDVDLGQTEVDCTWSIVYRIHYSEALLTLFQYESRTGLHLWLPHIRSRRDIRQIFERVHGTCILAETRRPV